MADGASLVRMVTSSMSAVSWLDFQTSWACWSGESSSPNAAWMPPCALAELHDWIEPFVARATRAPDRLAETAAASPEAPLPTTSTSKGPFPDIAQSLALFQRFRQLITDLCGHLALSWLATLASRLPLWGQGYGRRNPRCDRRLQSRCSRWSFRQQLRRSRGRRPSRRPGLRASRSATRRLSQ